MKTIKLIWDVESGKHVPDTGRPTPARKGQFIPPIPAGWFRVAAHAPGKALAVAAIVRMEAAKRHTKQVKLTGRMTESFGINQPARQRALAALEAAGLIHVERQPRKTPVVTILDIDKE